MHRKTFAQATALCGLLLLASFARATPANKAALEKHYDTFLARNLARCTTCHRPSDNTNPESLEDFPHNPFGARLRAVGRKLVADGKKKDIPARLALVAAEDADGDGVNNETELLLGHNPGDAQDRPDKEELVEAKKKRSAFAKFLASYRWQPFEKVQRPQVPRVGASRVSNTAPGKPGQTRAADADFPIRNPIDAFIAAEHRARGLQPRPEAAREILLRRVYLDLIGLSPTPEELAAFEADSSPLAYEKVVDRLLQDARYGERWGRHWMDVWRYSDWAGWSGGNQIRDSQPHIWRWRDWIVESLNNDKPYDGMVIEMLAADELAPEDTNALAATGFLVRNYKMLSREQWLEDTVKHTAQAFLGVTMGCAKCHDHMYDPLLQKEYYEMRAVFEPHWVRIDRIPGETNTMTAGLVRVFDTDTNPPTYFYHRGDERRPDTNRVIAPGVPKALGGTLSITPVTLPFSAAFPDQREFVIRDTIAASEKVLSEMRDALATLTNSAAASARIAEQQLAVSAAEARHAALLAVIAAEKHESDKAGVAWKHAATNAVQRQREAAVAEARVTVAKARAAEAAAISKADKAAEKIARATNDVQQVASRNVDLAKLKESAAKATKEAEAAKKKTKEAVKALDEAEQKLSSAPGENYEPRAPLHYPQTSTGRRLAFARWIADTNNPLTARVAMNHIWLRHFGRGIVPTPADFGRNGKPPSHPQLLDWLAAELMARGWSMKAMHRLIVTSSTYRMASTPDPRNARVDPDNVYLWRMPSRRMEAELVRDNLLYVSGELDLAMGGPDIDHQQGLTSKRRSLYLRTAAEKEVEFLKIFDGPAVTECYTRRPSVVPQQALALANSELTAREARATARAVNAAHADPASFVGAAFLRVLARHATAEEEKLCRAFLEKDPAHGRENLVNVLLNHNDFVTIR